MTTGTDDGMDYAARQLTRVGEEVVPQSWYALPDGLRVTDIHAYHLAWMNLCDTVQRAIGRTLTYEVMAYNPDLVFWDMTRHEQVLIPRRVALVLFEQEREVNALYAKIAALEQAAVAVPAGVPLGDDPVFMTLPAPIVLAEEE
jgi:hypothetical protein